MADLTTSRTTASAVPASAWGVLAVVTAALFLEGIDIAMLNVAVPSIAADIGLPTGSAHWIISAYVLAYGGFMILGGRVADMLGRRRVFLFALSVFAAFSLFGGFAQDAGALIVVRLATGAAAGFMTPAGFSLLTTAFPAGSHRGRALAIYGAVGAAGFYLGVVVGGVITSLGWRWVFFVPAVIAGGFLIIAFFVVPSDGARRTLRERFDVGGAVTLTGAMMSFIYGVVAFGEHPADPLGWGSLALAVVLLVAFAIIERRVSAPLIPAGVLTQARVPRMSLIGMLFFASFFAWQFLLTLFLQRHLQWGPLETGLVFVLGAIELVIAPLLTPRLAARFGNLPVLTVGLAVLVVAFSLTLRLSDASTFWDLTISLVLLGMAFALVYGPLMSAAVEGMPEQQHGVAGGIVYTGFQFGAALGVALGTLVLMAGPGDELTAGDYNRAMFVPLAAAGAAAAIAVITGIRSRHRAPR